MPPNTYWSVSPCIWLMDLQQRYHLVTTQITLLDTLVSVLLWKGNPFLRQIKFLTLQIKLLSYFHSEFHSAAVQVINFKISIIRNTTRISEVVSEGLNVNEGFLIINNKHFWASQARKMHNRNTLWSNKVNRHHWNPTPSLGWHLSLLTRLSKAKYLHGR